MIEYLDPPNFGVVRTRLNEEQLNLVWNLVKKDIDQALNYSGNYTDSEFVLEQLKQNKKNFYGKKMGHFCVTESQTQTHKLTDGKLGLKRCISQLIKQKFLLKISSYIKFNYVI